MYNRRILLITTAVAFLAGCAARPSSLSVSETIAGEPSLSTLNSLVIKSGLAEPLKGSGPFTVFAPSNEAFAKLSAKTMDELSNDPVKLKALITYHVMPVKVMAGDVKNGSNKTVHGANIALSKAGRYVTIEDALVQMPDVVAANGVVHIIDSVLVPPGR